MLVREFKEWLSTRHSYSDHSIEAYVRDVSLFLVFLEEEYEGLPATEVTRPIVRTYLAGLLRDRSEKTTVSRKIASLRVFYNYMMQQHGLNENPARNIKPPKLAKKLPVFLSEKEAGALLSEMPDPKSFTAVRNRLVLELLYGTGIRVTELTSLKQKDVFPSDGLIRVLGKGGKERYVPFPRPVKQLLEAYMHMHPQTNSSAPLLVTETGRPVYRQLVYRLVRQATGEVTTLQKRSPHVLRHTFATHLLNSGADLNAVKELLGHSSLAATEKYTHTTFEHLKKIHRKTHPRG